MMLPRRYLLRRGLAASFLLPGLAEAKRRALHLIETNSNLPLVVIDPGHGGKDPGAIGITGIYEKQVALSTAELLSHLLISSGRYRVAMTRTSDRFIALEHRVDFAHARKADLFVSMHADALPDPTVRGASVYTLSDHASDRQTEALAQSENSADRFAGPSFRSEPPMVASILTSLLEKETKIGSARMAQSVVAHLGRELPLLANPSRQARFMVLRAADIPSVLVEMGFMSNPLDEAALHRPDHRMLVANTMKNAVDSYFAAADALTKLPG
jgi:N-acetylmuramoyl-L-alanine amidase